MWSRNKYHIRPLISDNLIGWNTSFCILMKIKINWKQRIKVSSALEFYLAKSDMYNTIKYCDCFSATGLYVTSNPQRVFIFLMSHHLKPLSSAERLIGLSLWEMVLWSAVGSQLDGLLRGRLVGLVLLIELLEQQPLVIAEVSSCPLVAGFCQYNKMWLVAHISTERQTNLSRWRNKWLLLVYSKIIFNLNFNLFKLFKMSLHSSSFHL